MHEALSSEPRPPHAKPRVVVCVYNAKAGSQGQADPPGGARWPTSVELSLVSTRFSETERHSLEIKVKNDQGKYPSHPLVFTCICVG